MYDPEASTLQQLPGWRAGRFQHAALALAPRTPVLNDCSSFKDSHGRSPRSNDLARSRAVRAQRSR
eukprot:55964-Pyramimonas_sp.AAC.1